jgi:hypothetical protein
MEAEFKEVNLTKTDPELVDKIAYSRDIPIERVRKMMRHSCWNQKQYAELTGKSVQTINNLMVYGRRKNNKNVMALNVCNPWPDKSSMGPNFIVRDQLSMDVLIKSLKQ